VKLAVAGLTNGDGIRNGIRASLREWDYVVDLEIVEPSVCLITLLATRFTEPVRRL
jgi:hypothetical protein